MDDSLGIEESNSFYIMLICLFYYHFILYLEWKYIICLLKWTWNLKKIGCIFRTIWKNKNTVIWDNVEGSWEYHAQWDKWDRKVNNHRYPSCVGYATESNTWTRKTNKQELPGTDYSVMVTRGKGVRGVKVKRDQLYGDGGRMDLGWWAPLWCNEQISYHRIVHLKPIYSY